MDLPDKNNDHTGVVLVGQRSRGATKGPSVYGRARVRATTEPAQARDSQEHMHTSQAGCLNTFFF